MCNSSADGGKRCDFHNPATSSIMDKLVATTHANDDVVKEVWKDLRTEGKNTVAPTREQFAAFIEDQKLSVSSNPFLLKDEKKKFLRRLDKSAEVDLPSGAGFYAMQNITEEVKNRRPVDLIPNLRNVDTDTDVITGDLKYENWPLPQANNLDKLATVVDAIDGGATTSDSIGESIDVVDRQGSYYANAAGYLGLVDKSKDEVGVTEFSLTAAGQQFLALDTNERTVMLAQLVKRTPLMQTYEDSNGDVSKLEREIAGSGLEDTVARRRASTITMWNKSLTNSPELLSSISSCRQATISRAVAASQKQADMKAAKKSEMFASIAKQHGTICSSCFMAMPMSGVCDNC